MKKLLSLLSVLTISGTAVPTTIAASPYQKQETIKNSDINYQQTNNLENLKRNKRQFDNSLAWIYEKNEKNKPNKECYNVSNIYNINLKTDLPDYDNFNKINLGILNNNNDFSLMYAIGRKYINFDTNQAKITSRETYSNFTKSFSFKLKIENQNDEYKSWDEYFKYKPEYCYGVLRPTFTYITKEKLKEISSYIEDHYLVKQWLQHINDYNKNLPTKIEQLKNYTNSQKWTAKNTEKEIIKGYIRDWNYVSNLIEHELKLDELNKNVQGLKSGFENLKNKINELDNRVNNLEQPNNCETNGYVVSGVFGVAALAPIPVFQEITAAVSAISGAVAAFCGL